MLRGFGFSFFAVFVAAAFCVHAQTTTPAPRSPQQPRASASEYPVSATIGSEGALVGVQLGAENLARSIPVSAGGMLFAPDHLVVEVGIHGPHGRSLEFSTGRFSLAVNGKKIPIYADSPGSVAGSLSFSSWNSGPHMEATGSMGGGGVILGRRPPPETGAPDIDGRTRGQAPPRAPQPEDRSGVAATRSPLNLRTEIEDVSFVPGGGPRVLPVSGLLFFPYRGKLRDIKSLVLLYQPPGSANPVSLSLMP